ncbi:BPSL0761 family protein [Halopseudomonas pachastrellae]|nr:hypothetical protein [Pseudomonadales bacterium]WVM91452.1 BPSL0761 family protein [Halopseudomonas pachastrellae]
MTLPHERTRAIVETEKFLKELSRDSGLPHELRAHAKALLRHYPSASQVFALGRLEEALMEDGPDTDEYRRRVIALHFQLLSSTTEYS